MRAVGLSLAAVTAAIGLIAAACWAQVDEHMSRAQRNLESAADHLQATPYDYGGHRKKALEHVHKALDEIHKAEFGSPPTTKEEKDELKREQRDEKLEHKQEQREEQLEERGH